jgi:hypothetical protein
MYRVLSAFVLAVAFIFACVLIPFGLAAGPANAGEYYDDGYYRHSYADNVWYSSHCCYRKIVRHEQSVRYVRVENEAPYYQHGYYERPYYERSYSDRSYYERPYRSSYYYERPYRWGHYVRPWHYVDYSYTPSDYTGYRYWDTSVYSRHAENCGRIPLRDGTGGWVWSRRAGCF